MTTLYLFGSAAPPVFEVAEIIENAQARGWDVCLGLTPTAARWLGEQLPELERLTGHPVRSEYKLPGEPDVWPPADAILLAPATFNTINAWALGLTSSFVVGVVAEGIGKKIPTVAMPCVNAAYVQHPQFDRSVETLRGAGVTVLYGEGGFVPNRPGERRPEGFPWHLALDAVGAIVSPAP
ncbi:flavoprotein [Streptomyces sp. NBC_01591]|uniref:flavoprotein n=1 Tax=Streptomyces sp. NBC_01591 TaxID=2975888 RepID=UPI002DDA8B3D|nr:flavoprotein [Streptomyces sp. NBC_01591]WSD71969.1 flavoprotein [Streptomyces sp. NBC_01591]